MGCIKDCIRNTEETGVTGGMEGGKINMKWGNSVQKEAKLRTVW
jgi:hypothetical protein